MGPDSSQLLCLKQSKRGDAALEVHSKLHITMWGFPKIMGTLLGVPIIRTIVFLGLYWGPLFLGNYHVKPKAELEELYPKFRHGDPELPPHQQQE